MIQRTIPDIVFFFEITLHSVSILIGNLVVLHNIFFLDQDFVIERGRGSVV